jgi:hypothetical protein
LIDDAERIALLLTSRHDWMAQPRGATAHLDAPPGPQPSRLVPCEPCAGTGRSRADQPCITCRDAQRAGRPIRRPNHGCRPCPNCDGRGDRRARKDDAPYERYSGRPLSELERERNEAQERTSRRLVLAASELPQGESATERLRRSYYESGSYAELDAAMLRLEARHPERHSQIVRWTDLGGYHADHAFGWTPEARLAIRGTLWLLAEAMPQPIRVPRWVRRAAQRGQRERPDAAATVQG